MIGENESLIHLSAGCHTKVRHSHGMNNWKLKEAEKIWKNYKGHLIGTVTVSWQDNENMVKCNLLPEGVPKGHA